MVMNPMVESKKNHQLNKQKIPIYLKGKSYNSGYPTRIPTLQGGPQADRYKLIFVWPPHKWPNKKWVTGVITPLKTGSGPPCTNHYQPMCDFGSPGLGYKLHKENANDFEDLGLRDLARKLSWLKGCILK